LATNPEPIRISDDFSQNTLKDYEVKGDVTWERGRVKLGPDARLARNITPGWMVEVTIDLEFPTLEKDGDKSESRIRFVVDDAADYLAGSGGMGMPMEVRLKWQRNEGKASGEFRIVEIRESALVGMFHRGDAKPVERVFPLHGGPAVGTWSFRYHLGLIEVEGPQQERGAAYVNNESAGVKRLIIIGTRSATSLSGIRITIHPRIRSLSANDNAKQLAALGDLIKGYAQYQTLKYQEALSTLEKAHTGFKGVFGAKHSCSLEALNWIGRTQHANKDYEAARSTLETSVRLHEETFGRRHPATADTMSDLAELLSDLGEYDRARTLLEQVLSVQQAVYGLESSETADCLNLLGEALRMQGRLADARTRHEEALQLRKNLFGLNHSSVAASLNNVGLTRREMGDLVGARKFHEEALAVFNKTVGPDHAWTAAGLHNLALVLVNQHNCGSALPLLQRALEIRKLRLGENHPLTGLTIGTIGLVHEYLGNFGEARKYYERALKICSSNLGPDHPQTALHEYSLASSLMYLGEFTSSRSHLETALKVLQKTLGPDHPKTAFGLCKMSELLQEIGDIRAARPYAEEALAARRKRLGPTHPQTLESLLDMGQLLVAGNELSAAWEPLIEAHRGERELAQSVLRANAEREHQLNKFIANVTLYMLFSLAHSSPSLAHTHGMTLFDELVHQKGMSSELLLARREGILFANDPQARDIYSRLKELRQRMIDQTMRGPRTEGLEKHLATLRELRSSQDELERKLADLVADYAAHRRALKVGAAQITAQLAAGTVVFEFVKFGKYEFNATLENRLRKAPEFSYATLLVWRDASSPAGYCRFIPLGDSKSIDRAIHAWRTEAQAGKLSPETEQRLHERLWDPLEKALPTGTDNLIIAPDGELSLLPFEAIRLADGKYLIERYSVRYITSGRDLVPIPPVPGESGPAVVMADPDYETVESADAPAVAKAETPDAANSRGSPQLRAGLHFTSLAATRKEAEATAHIWKKSGRGDIRVLLGKDATEEALAGIKRPRLLHIATHGFFLSDLPTQNADLRNRLRDFDLVDFGGSASRRLAMMQTEDDPQLRSGLALAGANRAQERAGQGKSDGLLTAREVQDLDLWGTELVVLSACETGLGEVQVGEGVLGLRRAFQLAGAQTVLASLWKVPDTETEQLMSRFFELWLSGKHGKAAALRQAQLEMIAKLRQDPKRKDAPPLYWAGFICHGKAD
jgi:CHAT domain-containing protein/tetratricopeptide (TPR) repeat protein